MNDSYIRYRVCLERTDRQIVQCNIYTELVSTCLPVLRVIMSWLQCSNKNHMIFPKKVCRRDSHIAPRHSTPVQCSSSSWERGYSYPHSLPSPHLCKHGWKPFKLPYHNSINSMITVCLSWLMTSPLTWGCWPTPRVLATCHCTSCPSDLTAYPSYLILKLSLQKLSCLNSDMFSQL